MASVAQFTAGPVEELRARLRSVDEWDPDAALEAADAKARETVDGDARWSVLQGLAEQVLEVGNRNYLKVERVREDWKEDRFTEWYPEAQADFAGTLLAADQDFERVVSEIERTFPNLAIPVPVTTVDATNLATRVRVFTEATPDEAARLVRDAIQRRDAAFVAVARTLLKSWPRHRNAWSSPDGSSMALELLVEIDGTVPDLVRLTGEYADERVRGARVAWRYLLQNLLNGDGRIDPTHRQVGALSPLLEPEN